MKKLYILAISIYACLIGHTQTSFNNPTEGVAVPILKLSSGNGGMVGSGGTIDFYKGAEAHPMGRIYTSNLYSSGVGNSVGKLTLSSYYNAYKDELTLYNGNVGIGTAAPLAKLHINAGLDKNLFFRLASDFGVGVSSMGIQSVNNANTLYMPLEIEGSALLLNAATKGRVGIGTASPQGALDVDGNNANGWSYFRANAGGFNPSSSTNAGLIIGWNPSAGQGETQILYGSGLGGSPRLDFGRWNGSAKTIDMSLNNGNVGFNGSVGIGGNVGIGTAVNSNIVMDIDAKTEWEDANYLRLLGSTYYPLNYNLTIKKVNTREAGTDHPTFNYDFNHYQFSGINGTQLSLKYNGDVGIGGGLIIQDASGYLTGGSIKPGVDGLVTNGGNKLIIIAGQEVRINAPLLLAKKVKVSVNQADGADYVFSPGYHLRSLTSVENYINKYKHLPDVPSAREVEKNELDLGASQALLLKKIEELTLYMIKQDKTIKEQQKLLEALQKEIKK